MSDGIILDNFASFGDGNVALILNRRKYKGEDGITYWDFRFRPGRRTVEIYNLEEELDPIDGSITKEYPDTEVSVVDENPNHLRVWIFTDFNGNPTPVSKIDDDKDLQILNLQKRIATLELELSETHRMLKTRATPEAYIAQASEMIKRARTAAAKQQVGGDGEMGGEEEYDE
jgi:hypothetical protein